MLAVALFALGIFAAIYHPVGTAMVIENATQRGRTLAFNGVCGNLGVSLAAGTTALLTAAFSWRGAFLLPGLICIVTGAIYLWLVPDEARHKAARSASPDVALSKATAAIIFGLFVVVALSAGLVFNTLSVALPKIVDERVSGNISLLEIGGLTTAVFICGALAQIAIGRLVEIFRLHVLFATLAIMQFAGVVWTAYASGVMVLFALAFTMAAIYGQITVNDLIIARYTADAWRGRVYAVRYFLTFMVSGVAVSMIAFDVRPRRLCACAGHHGRHRARLPDRRVGDRLYRQRRRTRARATGGAGGIVGNPHNPQAAAHSRVSGNPEEI